MAIVEISIVPVGTGNPSFSNALLGSCEYLDIDDRQDKPVSIDGKLNSFEYFGGGAWL